MRVQFPCRIGGAAPSPKIGLFLAGVMLSTWCNAQDLEYEGTTAPFQTTYNWQKHPSFAADYQHFVNPAYNVPRAVRRLRLAIPRRILIYTGVLS